MCTRPFLQIPAQSALQPWGRHALAQRSAITVRVHPSGGAEGKTIASGGFDTTVRLWEASTGKPIGEPLTGHTGTVNNVAFSPDGTTIASSGDDETVWLWPSSMDV